MKPKMIVKITVDLGMTIFLMLLMAFELIGRTAHEWIGAGMFVLFILHHILNRKWTGTLHAGCLLRSVRQKCFQRRSQGPAPVS